MPDHKAIAIVGVGAVLPDAPGAEAFWENVKEGRYSISEVPPERWDPEIYWDPDPKVPDKTYSKIGGWVRSYEWEPLKWRLPIPPKVSDAMDRTQKWAIMGAREALADYGYPQRRLDPERTAVILGSAMAGDLHYRTAIRIAAPELTRGLGEVPAFAQLPPDLRRQIEHGFAQKIGDSFPPITEDTMPGELANIIAGRIANLFDFHGPNYVVDAACASAMAAISAAVEGLEENDYDAVVTGGIDANMGASTFTKFCKIGALSATGTRPYAAGADGFVMGEGAAVFLLKRLQDAERDGDRIYAVIRGLGGSSDGKGKGITAPNPVGQRLAVSRAWARAGVRPDRATLIEGHGTSTRVGDVVEVESLAEAFQAFGLPAGSVPLGSVKSNIGHLKGAAGAAGILKAAFALRDRLLPASLGFERPNPEIDFAATPFRVNSELAAWEIDGCEARTVGVSAFGFGGTNFHAVLEEHIPGRLTRRRPAIAIASEPAAGAGATKPKSPPRGVLMLGGDSTDEIAGKVRRVLEEAEAGRAPRIAAPRERDLRARLRLTIDYGNDAEIATKASKVLKALDSGRRSTWRVLQARGIYLGEGPAPKVAFLYTGQGSQYLNMLRTLRDSEPVVAETFEEADRVLTPLLGKPLSRYIFIEPEDAEAWARADRELRQTAITQPAVLAADVALSRLLAAYGVIPDMVMGHSLGEYGALVASGVLSFRDALAAVCARGREMSAVSVEDNGMMAAVFAPPTRIQEVLDTIDGYVVIANHNGNKQSVIGGATAAVEAAIAAFQAAHLDARPLPVSHAFHTDIVSPASAPLRRVLEHLDLGPPSLPVVSNVTGGFYPVGAGSQSAIVELLARQVASPVQFVKGLETLYDAGARVFVEVGPKRALVGMVEDVLGGPGDVLALYTNHSKDDLASFNNALCGLYAAGLGVGGGEVGLPVESPSVDAEPPRQSAPAPPPPEPPTRERAAPAAALRAGLDARGYQELGRLFADFLERGMEIYGRQAPSEASEPVVITGAALGLPGTERVFDDGNVARILRGDQLIGPVPERFREAMVDKNITRLVKSERGEPRFETIGSTDEVIKLAGRRGELDLATDFGFPEERLPALDVVTQLAIGAGIDALRDAGIPLLMRYKTTTTGGRLPERWGLPDALRDDTGVIFGSAFPGIDFMASETRRYHADRARRERLKDLEDLRRQLAERGPASDAGLKEIDRRIDDLRRRLESEPYTFDRRFLFKLLSMGHSQFAEYIGARGPNTQINAACATTTQAVGLAEDWIRSGRCRRVVIISGDDVTSDELLEWIGAGFLASGAAATDGRIEDAAIPFDRRRHGMLVGMGAAALVVESAEAARERGLTPICQVLSAVTANSAFHGTRLDVDHISAVMEQVVGQAERRWGVDRRAIAPETVFISHETYTPARGGSAQAEIYALRRVFGDSADHVVIANTKGYTGHPMAVGIEDVLAVKALETGIVPPVPNFREVDPDLGHLNLSRGGDYPVRYALRLGAGFGSQISMSLLAWVPSADGRRPSPSSLGYAYRIAEPDAWEGWLASLSGHPTVHTEVVRRTFRVKDQGPPEADAAASPARATAVPAETAPPVAPVETAPAPRPAPSPPAATSLPGPEPPAAIADPVAQRVLQIVTEATGYPGDMLDLDLDMEADLGIDTVKQAEMFAAIREEWAIPRDDELQLRDFPTLAHAIQFVYDRRPDLERTPSAAARRPAPEAAPPVAQAPAPTPGGDPVQSKVLEIVAAATGYPTDMLDLDLDMEADLGIDTVKQAEMFAAIREEWNIPRDDELQLRDFPTLAHAVRFVYDRRPDLGRAPAADVSAATPPPPEPAAAPTPAATEAAAQDAVEAKVLQIVEQATGYPTDMLDFDLDMEADLGIDTVKQAEMFAAIREEWNIPRDDELQLRDFPTLADAIRFVYERRPDLQRVAPGREADDGAPAAAVEPEDAVAPAPETPRRMPVAVLRPPLELCKPTGVTLEPGRRVIVAPDRGGVARALAGRLGKLGVEALILGEAADPTTQVEQWLRTGPVDGVYWLPALDDEGDWRQLELEDWHRAVHCRVKRMYATLRALYGSIGEPGTFLVSATRLGGRHGYDEAGAVAPLGGAVTGFTKAFKRERPGALVKAVDFAAGRKTAAPAERLIDETLRDPGAVEVGWAEGRRWTVGLEERELGGTAVELPADPVYVVTGAAGSIVSAIIADLAGEGGTFYLLDLTPEPDPADPDLERFAADRDALKRELFERIKRRGERATPAAVEHHLAALERSLAALAAIRAVEAAGAEACYRRVDLLDAEGVAAVIDEVRRRHGRIDVLVHAAGLEISHMLADKEPREFDLVFDVKSDGWFHLLGAIGDLPLRASVVFSSIAGRFGNAGQADYSSANDLLCKSTSWLSSRGVRAVAIDWTAWGDIGMATRGSIPKMMEAAGIDMLPPETGIPIVRRELAAGSSGEVVVAGGLGALLEEWDETGGLDVRALAERPLGPMVTRVVGAGIHSGLTAETTLDPRRQPFLDDHRIDGTPVLPGVMGIEAFAEAAMALFPDRRVAAIEDMDFLAPFKFYRGEPRTLSIEASFTAEGDDVVAACRLIGRRTLAKQTAPRVTLHFTARVRLATELPAPATRRPPAPPTGSRLERDAIYRIFFHGPAYRVLESAWSDDGLVVGRLPDALPANHLPDDGRTIVAPRLIELCFQTAGVKEIGETGRLGLPEHLDRVRMVRDPETAEGRLHAVVEAQDSDGFDVYVVDEAGQVFVVVEGYRTAKMPSAVPAAHLEPLRAVVQP